MEDITEKSLENPTLLTHEMKEPKLQDTEQTAMEFLDKVVNALIEERVFKFK
jgi:hypothetical protein